MRRWKTIERGVPTALVNPPPPKKIHLLFDTNNMVIETCPQECTTSVFPGGDYEEYRLLVS
jgi:hypothetical protein